MNSQFSISAIIMIVEACVLLFQFRGLLQNSSADFYNKITQAVLKLTNPVMKFFPNKTFKGFFISSFVVAFLIALVASIVVIFSYANGLISIVNILIYGVIVAILMFIKCFGYLVIFLLLAQALTSWLPSTRMISIYFGQVTRPIVAPIQKIIPPIGMIDISLMVVLIAIYALNTVIIKVLQHIDTSFFLIWLNL